MTIPATASPGTDGGWTEVLRGGDRVRIRPIHADDAAMERQFIEELSPQSRRFRFLDSMLSPSDALLRQLTAIPSSTDVAYVAVVDDLALNHEIGVGRFSAQSDGQDCEFAIVVDDKWQNKGLATHLMRHLIEAARRRGISRMHSNDPADNQRMRSFAAHMHLDHRPDPLDATQVLYSMEMPPSEVARTVR